MSDKAVFSKYDHGKYFVNWYTVVPEKGIELVPHSTKDGSPNTCGINVEFVKGSKVEGENINPKVDGVLVEQLIAVCVDHLKTVNVGELATRETSIAIIKLEESLLWLLKRELDRKRAGTLGTYKK